MRFSKWLMLVAILATPYLAVADDGPSIEEIEASGITTGDPSNTGSGVNFDPAYNTLGNPNNVPVSYTTGSTQQLTFLSGGADPVSITVNIVNLSLSFLGLLSLIFILYAGYKWFVARDNEEEVTKAKDILKGAVVGLAIVLGSMGLAQLLFNTLLTSSTVQTSSLMDWIAAPAYADEEAPTYEPEQLDFDPYTASHAQNVAVGDGTLLSLYFVDLGTADPVTFTLAIVNIALTLLGFAFLILLIYAGVLWATARGNEETIGKAKTTLIRAVIGLIIILGAYGIATLITSLIYQQTLITTP